MNRYFDSYCSDPRRIQYAGSETDGLSVDYKGKYTQQLQVIKDNYATFAVPYNGEDNNDYVDGELVQHIEYVPFGEVFVEERNNIWNTPYLFNAKEFDEETGLYYYGARYYEPRLGLWISCDPEEENYPTFNSYCYTANNHIRYIDTDGEKIVSLRGNIAVTLDRDGNFYFTSNATASIKRVTKALLLTPKGRDMLTKVVKSDINVNIIISPKSDIEALPDNRKSYTYGTTLQGNGNSNDNYGRKVDKNGKYYYRTIKKIEIMIIKKILVFFICSIVPYISKGQCLDSLKSVCLPDSIAEQIENNYKDKYTNASKNVVNLISPNNYNFVDGIYAFKGMGPHFPRQIFVYKREKIFIFNSRGD